MQDIHRKVLPYFVTFIVTLSIVFCFSFLSLFFFDNASDSQEENFYKSEYDQVYQNYTIDFLKQEELLHPNDYKINYNLGVLYELYSSFEEARQQYLLAIEKAPDKQDPRLNLADLYIILKQYEKSQYFLSSVSDNSTNKKLLFKKAIIYEKMGDHLFQQKRFKESFSAYQKAFYYLKKIRKDKEKIKHKMLMSGIETADDLVLQNSPKFALDQLYNLLTIKDSSILHYKIGLILFHNDQKKALYHIEKAYKEDSKIVNPQIYKSLLINLIDDKSTTMLEKQLYLLKIRKLEKREKDVIIFDDEFKLLNLNVNRVKILNLYTKVIISFKIRNNTNIDLQHLYLTCKYFNKGKEIGKITIDIVDKSKDRLLCSGRLSQELNISKYFFNVNIEQSDILVKLYLSKKDNNKDLYQLCTFVIK